MGLLDKAKQLAGEAQKKVDSAQRKLDDMQKGVPEKTAHDPNAGKPDAEAKPEASPDSAGQS